MNKSNCKWENNSLNRINMSQKREYPRVREQLVDTRSRRTDTLLVSTVTRRQGTACLESVNAGITQNICAEGVALRWDTGAISAMQKVILLLFVARSVTLWIVNDIKRKKSNVKGPNHIVAKPKVTEEDRLSVTSKVTKPNHRLKLVNRLRSSVWLTAQRRKTLGS